MIRSSRGSRPSFIKPVLRTLALFYLIGAAGPDLRPARAAAPADSTAASTGASLAPGAAAADTPQASTASAPPVAATVQPPAPGPTLWIDLEKNAARLTSPRAIEAVVDSAYRSGFTRLIIDLKKADGSVVFKSRRAPQVNLPFDYFGAFRKAADKRGMETIADFEVFTEGDTRTEKGPAYDHPEWQTVVGNQETGLMRQSDFFQKGPVLFVNPGSVEVQRYEMSVIEDLLTELKPSALLLDEMRFYTRDADMSDSTHMQFEAWAGLSHASATPDAPESTCWPGSVQRINSPRIPLWARFRVGVIREFLGRVRSLQQKMAPETALYLAAPGYFEAAVNLGMNWSHSSYTPVLWYADEKFQKMAMADILDQIVVLNRDANPRAMSEVVRGARKVTQDRLPLAVLVDPGQHFRSPNRFRECLQTLRNAGVGLVVTDLARLGDLGYWTIVREEYPPR